jgi:glycerol-3-phosphate dehydrogenase (NAD(P)+)
LGRGEKAPAIAASTLAVAEGYPTARAAYQLARNHGIITPVIDEVYAMLYESKDVGQAVRALMSRDLKPE